MSKSQNIDGIYQFFFYIKNKQKQIERQNCFKISVIIKKKKYGQIGDLEQQKKFKDKK